MKKTRKDAHSWKPLTNIMPDMYPSRPIVTKLSLVVRFTFLHRMYDAGPRTDTMARGFHISSYFHERIIEIDNISIKRYTSITNYLYF